MTLISFVRRLALAAGVAAVSACSSPTEAGFLPIDMTGEWVADADASGQFFSDAESFRFVLVQSGSAVSGTWGATGPEGVVVRLDQQVSGEVAEGDVALALRYSRYAHGCVGPSRDCFDLLYRVIGTAVSADRIDVQVLPPPHPTIPDSEMVLAEWTLRRPLATAALTPALGRGGQLR